MTLSVSGDSITFNDLSVQNTAATGFGFKNRIINGGMQIDQRNAGASVANIAGNQYQLDRFQILTSVSSKFTTQQNAGGVTPPTGFSKYFGITSSSAYAIGAGDYFILGQLIEGFNTADLAFGTANAKSVTLSFQVYSSLTGTFGGALQNSSSNRCYPFSYSIPTANTWTTIYITVAGDTTGTWVGATNGTGLQVWFGLGVGSTYSATAGAWGTSGFSATGAVSVVGTSGATFYITGVQLEKGSVATSFDYRDYGRELIMCQRYFYVIPSAVQYSGATCFSTNRVLGSFSCATTFRATPTVIGAANSIYYFTSGAANLSSAVSLQASLQGTVSVDITATATTGNSGVISTNSPLTLTAEL